MDTDTDNSLTVNWECKPFDELTNHELYEILRLRSEVFVVEQNCVFLDMDNKDQHALHLMGWMDVDLAAYVRILPPGLAYQEPSIGRVVSSPKFRRTGIGRQLMEEAIRITTQIHGNQPIRIGAQLYLKNFYGSLGFEPEGNIYLEDGIEHIEMVRVAQ
jgi:ElaA protein